MKKLLMFIGAMFVCTFAFAHTINWHVGDQIISTTTCNSGDNITPPTVPSKRGYHLKEWAAGYIQLEYIEATGTQWIDTGHAYTSELTRTYAEFAYTTKTVTQKNLFGCSINDSEYITGYIQDARMKFFIGSGEKAYISFSTNDNAKHVVDIYTPSSIGQTGYVTIDGSDIAYTKNTSNVSGANMGIFTQIDATKNLAMSRCGSFKIYKFIMWDNDTLVRDFIPAKRVSDYAIGMYDTVTQTFFTNAGTGQFIAGPMVGEL